METKEYKMCGGCGADHPNKRCIGCMHSFYPGDWPEKYEKPVQPSAEDRLAAALSVQKQLVEALEAFLGMYLRGANSGDWGNWNPEEEPEIIAARAAILAAKASS